MREKMKIYNEYQTKHNLDFKLNYNKMSNKEIERLFQKRQKVLRKIYFEADKD